MPNPYIAPRPVAETDAAFDPSQPGHQTENTHVVENEVVKRRFSITNGEAERFFSYTPVFCDSEGVVVNDAGTFTVEVVRIDLRRSRDVCNSGNSHVRGQRRDSDRVPAYQRDSFDGAGRRGL